MPTQYPASLDTQANTLWTAANFLQTTLTGDHSSSQTTIAVASAAGFPATGYIVVDSEAIKYTSISGGNVFNLTAGGQRGADGTSPANHLNGTIVKAPVVADHHNALATAIIALETKLGTNTGGSTGTSIDGAQLAAGSVGLTQLAPVTKGASLHKLQGYNNSSQLITSATFTKIQFQLHPLDTGNEFDATTNFRFTPTLAGYYYVSGIVIWQVGAAVGRGICTIYKNGAEYNMSRGSSYLAANQNVATQSNPSLIQMNGTTDYVELWAWQSTGGSISILGSNPDVASLTAFFVSS